MLRNWNIYTKRICLLQLNLELKINKRYLRFEKKKNFDWDSFRRSISMKDAICLWNYHTVHCAYVILFAIELRIGISIESYVENIISAVRLAFGHCLSIVYVGVCFPFFILSATDLSPLWIIEICCKTWEMVTNFEKHKNQNAVCMCTLYKPNRYVECCACIWHCPLKRLNIYSWKQFTRWCYKPSWPNSQMCKQQNHTHTRHIRYANSCIL